MQAQHSARTAKKRPGLPSHSDITELLALAAAAPRFATLPLAEPPRTAPAPAPAHTSPVVVDAPPALKSMNDIFTSYVKYEKDLKALTAQQNEIHKQLFGEEWVSIIDTPSTQGIYRIAESAIVKLIDIAQKRFAPPGGILEISQCAVLESTGQRHWRDDYDYDRNAHRSGGPIKPPVDLDKIWAHLVSTYEGDAGVQTFHKQNAQLIIQAFGMNRDANVKRTSKALQCTMSVYGELKTYGRNQGLYEVSYHSRDRSISLFKALALAFEWAEMDQLSIELTPARHRLTHYEFAYKPREKHTFTGLEIVFFKTEWQFKFGHSVAEKLMLYLGTFGEA